MQWPHEIRLGCYGRCAVLKGYCLLLPDPVVPHLNAMTMNMRQQFLSDMTILGDAVLNEI
jgi:hypothetical protein